MILDADDYSAMVTAVITPRTFLCPAILRLKE